MKQVRITVVGKVQGVWFRKYTRDQALKLHLTGWVRNESDGSVTIVACGTEHQLSSFVEWAHQGSPLSKVERVNCNFESPESHQGFDIR